MLRISLLSACVVLCGCDDPLSLKAEAATVCQHLSNQRFQVPPEVRAQVAQLPPSMQRGVEVSRTFAFDVSAALPPELANLVDSHFALTSITLTAVTGSPSLGFIDQAQVSLQPSAESGLPARQFDYVRAEPAPRTIIWSGEAFDLGAYLESGQLTYGVSLVGSLPEGDLVVDVDACAAVSVQFDYF